MKVSLISFACLVALLMTPANAQDAAETKESVPLDPWLPYQAERSEPVTYEVDFSVIVTPPYKTEKLAVWLPLPPSDVAQEMLQSKLSSFPLNVEPSIQAESTFGNRFAYFEFASPQGAQIIRHQFRIKVWQLNWKLDPARIAAIQTWPDSFQPYQRSESMAVKVDERFQDVLAEIVPQRANPAEDFGQVIGWVQSNFKYDHHDASLQARSEHGLEKRRGHCSDYHSFCASMGRALGVPTRVTYGINTFPKNSPSHCKLEAYLAPYGWVSFDVSETQKLTDRIQKLPDQSDEQKQQMIEKAQTRLMSGFRDNTWFLQTRGTEYELAPPASRKVSVVRTAYVEADGVPLSEPDPADKEAKGFSWMTAHEYQSDRPVTYPFSDVSSLLKTETP